MKEFYEDVIGHFSKTYPALSSGDVGWVKVLHAFSDKLPLVEVLSEHNLLSALVLKRGSSKLHPDIVQKIKTLAPSIVFSQSAMSPDHIVSSLSDVTQGRNFVMGDHGGYFADVIPDLKTHFEQRFMGITEHTRNGEVRIQQQLQSSSIRLPFLSGAQNDLKHSSDRAISYSIVDQIIEEKGTAINVVIVGYGVMGAHAADRLRQDYPESTITIIDECADRMSLAKGKGFNVADNISDVISQADVVLLATNRIKNQEPVLGLDDISQMKEGSLLTSMTSIEDEIDVDSLVSSRVLGQSHITLFNNGIPANTVLENGGADISICKIEAIGIASAFCVANGNVLPDIFPQSLLQKDIKIIDVLWSRRFS